MIDICRKGRVNHVFRIPKIDQSFVADLASNTKDAMIVEAVSALARSLGIGLVAEGVENIDQVQLLQELRCTEMQGYFYSRPLEPDHLGDIIAQLSQSETSIKTA